MAQSIDINKVNQSTGAKRIVSRMANSMRLDAAWLHGLLSLHWNYDKVGREAAGWIKPERNDALREAYRRVLSVFRLPETPISPGEAAQAVLRALEGRDEAVLRQDFAAAAARGDFAMVQEFRTYHYYRNATEQRLLQLWERPLTAEYIADKLFYKVFSAYHACDPYVCLVLPMPYVESGDVGREDWIGKFVGKVEA
ncbi:MAG: hypothetical protein Q3966_09880 [Neisseria sp.]|nr:hypothetical protein [Neisseria sp.]